MLDTCSAEKLKMPPKFLSGKQKEVKGKEAIPALLGWWRGWVAGCSKNE